MSWRSLLAAVGLVTAAAALAFAFTRSTPDGGLATLRHESGPFGFDAPAHWEVHNASAAFSGGFAEAVVGTVPVPVNCRLAVIRLDINCYYQERLRPGDVSIVLGGAAFRGHDAFQRMRAEAVQLVIDGRRVYRVDHVVTPDGYYRADRSATWYIERRIATAPDNFYTVDAQVRGPDADRLWSLVGILVGSLRFSDE